MYSGSYAVVAYITGPLGRFVEEFRRSIAPEEPRTPTHLTLLSPRVLESPREKLLAAVRRACYKSEPVRITLGEVESFVPSSSTIYLPVREGAGEISDLRRELNQYDLRAEELWPYVPHITLATFADHSAADAAMERAQRAWSVYTGPREFLVNQLTLVREAPPNRWDDLGTFALGTAASRNQSTWPQSKAGMNS